MDQYSVTGMSCAACQVRVEKAVQAVPGVESCAVSLLTNSMGVTGTAAPEAIIKAVEEIGYSATLKNSAPNSTETNYDEALVDRETPKLKQRLIASIVILLPLMYVSMGHMLWNWPLPPFFSDNHVAMNLYQLLLTILIMVINQKFFISGFKGALNRAPNMDTLVALGSSAAFIYSVYILFLMSAAALKGDIALVKYYCGQTYFESSATILTLITVGKMLEANAKGKTTNALKSLMKLAPKTAVILVDGKELTIPIEQVKVGDKFVVRPGNNIPVDGIVLEGHSAVNEAALTGESVPVEKSIGDSVATATINTSGHLVCQATRVGEDTTLAGIIQLVSAAATTKAPIAKIADQVSGIFVPTVILISLVTGLIWLLVGQTAGYAIARAVSVLVISCPCALGLATPVAIMVGNGLAAKTGILFKTAVALEQVGKTKIIALDKTGTVTTGIMAVTDVIPFTDSSHEELLTVAYGLEAKSEHPISKAITQYATEHKVTLSETTAFTALPGHGLKALLNGDEVAGGNAEYMKAVAKMVPPELHAQLADLATAGKTPIIFAKNGRILGLIAVADTIKTDSIAAIRQLKNMGIHVVMLTGDNEITARTIAGQAEVDEVIAEVKPAGKEEVIRQLMEYGPVTMVGDGINDAPALTSATIGIAIGAGADIAVDAADIVLMKSSIMDVVAAVRISRATLRNIHENLFWAFIYNIFGIFLAAGCFVVVFGWSLSPVFGAAAMGLSSFCVVSNALRLNLLKIYDDRQDHKISGAVNSPLIITTNNAPEREEKEMKIIVKGMMCGHCEAHVKKALEAIDGVTSVTASHQENLVTINSSKELDENLLKKAISDAGYEYEGIIC